MDTLLNEIEARVLGALIEKQIATPDYYPMTVNGLTNACNQKTSRDPVTSFDDHTVTKALETLREKGLAYIFHGSDSRVPKYGHTFARSLEVEHSEMAVLCVLMLRGAQTPGELRTRAGSLHTFTELSEVEATLESLSARGEDALVVRLPRQPGAQQYRYMHLLCGKPDVESWESTPPVNTVRASNDRVARLEEEVRQLREELAGLRRELTDFRKQFE